jgi:hypothetical protein
LLIHVGLQTGQKRDFLVGQVIEDRSFSEIRVEPQFGDITQLLALAVGFQKETLGTAGGMHVARPQHGMHKALAQSLATLKAVVVAAHRVAGHQRMKDILVVVTVVLDPRLFPVSLNWKAVDVDGDAPSSVVVARCPQMARRPIGQRLAEEFGMPLRTFMAPWMRASRSACSFVGSVATVPDSTTARSLTATLMSVPERPQR